MRDRKYIALSEIRPIRSVLYSRRFPEIMQVAMLAAFLGIIILGWGLSPPVGIDDKLFAKSNLVTLVIWGLWWPLMVVVAAGLGRVWCMVCPLELVGRIGERIGGMSGIQPRRLSRWLRAGWFMLLLYGVVQMLIAALHLHRVPMYTSLYLLFMLGLAAVSGILFRPRAICRAFCPVGLLLKVYGRGGMLAVRPASTGIPVDSGIAASCRSGLQPLRLDQAGGDDCIMCLDCVQADSKKPRMQWILRSPWSRADVGSGTTNLPVTLFIMMVSGFVSYEISGFWPGLAAAFLWIPTQLAEFLGLHGGNGWIKGLWIILVWPLVIWTLLGALAGALFRQTDLIAIWRRLAYPVSLFVIAFHVTKALEKLFAWSGFLPLALSDPDGVRTAQAITNGGIIPPEPLVGIHIALAAGCVLTTGVLFLLAPRIPIFKKKDSCGACHDTPTRSL